MIELWSEIPSFENYSISNYGAVRNSRGDLLSTGRNQQGVLYVQLWRGGKPYNRAIAPIVANAFLQEPPHHSWDTPIHLNGNRVDVSVENLMWRPRWFAIDYHQQILLASQNKVRDVLTREADTIKAMCMRFGLLPAKVFEQAADYTNEIHSIFGVWPTGQMFEFV